MNKISVVVHCALAVGCCYFGVLNFAVANDALTLLNQEVETRAGQIDQKYDLLLDGSERNELKLDLIMQRVLAQIAADSGKDFSQCVADAIETYQLHDIAEQRRLLIKLDTHMTLEGTGAGGTEPDYP